MFAYFDLFQEPSGVVSTEEPQADEGRGKQLHEIYLFHISALQVNMDGFKVGETECLLAQPP